MYQSDLRIIFKKKKKKKKNVSLSKVENPSTKLRGSLQRCTTYNITK